MDTGTEGLAATDSGVDASVDTGVADGANSAAEFQTEPSALGETAPVADSPTYTIKVDGVEQTVTLEELQSGYQRQADYTRKTQELAARRQQLAQAEALATALQRDPQGTLRALQEAYGMEVAPTHAPEIEEPLDPWEQKVVELERTIQQQQMAAQQAQIDAELDALRHEHGDFDDMELFTFAVQRGISDLPTAFRAWKFDEVRAAQAEAARVAAERAAEEARIAEAKRGLVGVEGGAHRTGVQAGTGRPNSIREAFLLTKQQTT